MAIALTIAYTPTPVPIGSAYLVEATAQLSAGRRFFGRSQFKKLAVVAAAAASPYNALAAYNAKFGALVSGKLIAFRLTPVTITGFRGDPVVGTIVIT